MRWNYERSVKILDGAKVVAANETLDVKAFSHEPRQQN